jgi:hypothetical protein
MSSSSTPSSSKTSNDDDVNNDVGGILLSLPQCDMERPDSDIKNNNNNNNNNSMNNNETNKKSMKTTTKKTDLVLFQLPSNSGSSNTNIVNDLWEGRCQIYANNSSACIVTPSTSLQLVTVGSSNAMVLWEKGAKKDNEEEGKESPMKRLKKSGEGQDNTTTTTTTTTTSNKNITNCRLVQPGGSGSSFLVGQSNELDPNELSRFFTTTSKTSSGVSTSTSTSELCNLFQVAPGQIRYAMLYVPTVVSYYNNNNEDEDEDTIEYWQLVPEEEVLFGQQALVETLCEEDDVDDDDNEMTIDDMTIKVSQRLLPLLMDMGTDNTKSNNDDNINNNINNNKEKRSLAIARKTLLLASSSLSSHTTTSKKNNRPQKQKYKPNTSKIAFYVLRDLFMKYPSYAWPDLVDKWSTRLPIGEQYERITSTTEWIEDTKVCGGLIPNQLTFSPSPSSSSSDNNNDESDNKNKNNNNNNNSSNSNSNSSKGVIRLVNPHSVLIWMGDDIKNK